MNNLSVLQLIADDPNVLPSFQSICRAEMDRRNLLTRRHAIQKSRQYEAEPVSITGFGPLAPCFRRFEAEPEPTAHERAADDYQDSRVTQDKEQRHFGRDE